MQMPRHRASQAEREQEVWNFFVENPTRDFFKDISIAPDGGFSEVLELWRPSRWFTALVTVLFLLMNLYYTFLIDILLILNPFSGASMPLISRSLFQRVADYVMDALGEPRYVIKADKWIALIELFLTGQMMFHLIYCSVIALTSTNSKTKWFNAEKVWWRDIPNLYSYSAMRLLHFVSPQVLPIHFSKFLYNFNHLQRLQFVLWRTIALIIGFDAFMLKCRESREFMSARAQRSKLATLWAGFVFLRQVLGIVQVNFEVQDRVFSFMFAGEDAIFQEEEGYRKNVWKAMLISEVFKQFKRQDGKRLGTAKGVALMLSFDDTDFQKLFLNQRPSTKRSAVQESSSASEEEEGKSGEESSSDEGRRVLVSGGRC